LVQVIGVGEEKFMISTRHWWSLYDQFSS